jgi:hypothetical protein
MSTAPNTWRFLLRVMLWLPVCFVAWYLSAAQLARPAGGISRAVAQTFQAGVVQQVEIAGTTVAFVTRVKVRALDGRLAVLAPEVNSMAYTFGSALFLALMLASRAQWQPLVAGMLLLLPFQGWGIAFDGLAQIVRASTLLVADTGISTGSVNMIAAGYQFGSLVFPTVVPVLAWGLFCRQYIELLRTHVPGRPCCKAVTPAGTHALSATPAHVPSHS